MLNYLIKTWFPIKYEIKIIRGKANHAVRIKKVVKLFG